jgi:transcriptional regulator with PAS, ATPase and Fis domain
LRRRPKDIIPLAYYFLQKHAKKNQKKIHEISSPLAEMLMQYKYPGNVRELEHVIASAILVEKSKVLGLASVQNLGLERPVALSQPPRAFPKLVDIQREHIEKALKITNGNRTKAAKLLGIGLRTLQRKLKAYALQ